MSDTASISTADLPGDAPDPPGAIAREVSPPRWDEAARRHWRLTTALVVALLCAAPWALHSLAGVDFGAPGEGFDADAQGPLVHSLLEAVASSAALMAGILALAQFGVRRDLVTPIVGLSLFWAGIMDGFHILASDRLISGVAPLENLAPFSWALARTVTALLLLVGGLIALRTSEAAASRRFPALMVFNLAFGVGAVVLMIVTTSLETLPRMHYPDALVARPFDVAPALLFLAAGIGVFPLLHARQREAFSFALWLSVLPHLAAQGHMAFGSEQLFDHDFMAAHGLKVLAYLVPFAGAVASYLSIHAEQRAGRRRLQHEVDERRIAERRLADYARELESRNRDLDEFAYVASHDLRTPLQGVRTLAEWIDEDAAEHLPEESRAHLEQLQGRVKRLERLLDDLLAYSRAGRRHETPTGVDVRELVQDIAQMYESTGARIEVIGAMPRLHTHCAPLEQVLRNLIGNAIKHNAGQDVRVWVTCRDGPQAYEFAVRDNGPGIDPRFHDKIFKMFETLHPRDSVEGSGMGLAIIRRILGAYGQSVSVESVEGEGAVFRFSWPKSLEPES